LCELILDFPHYPPVKLKGLTNFLQAFKGIKDSIQGVFLTVCAVRCFWNIVRPFMRCWMQLLATVYARICDHLCVLLRLFMRDDATIYA